MQNPTHQNYKHVKAVQELLGVNQSKLHNVVAFVGSAEPRTSMPPNVVWSVRSLVTYIKRFNQLLLTEAEVSTFTAQLTAGALEANSKTRRSHVKHVKSQSGQRGVAGAKCPRCGSKMVERTNRTTGDSFLGCSKFPKCRGTRKAA